ncbi:MAG TPA: rod shape-determining protein MreD [Firmicutes bacterium]|nr:rod shape-determining protein MreD [Bacillota bacterium]
MRRSKRIIVMAVIILAGFLLQYGVFANCPLIDTVPNILLIITVSFGFMKGKIQGMVIGLFCGFIMDIGSMDSIGYYMIIYILIGYINGALHQWMYSDYIVFPLIVTTFSSLLYGIYNYVFLFLIRNRTDIVYYLLHVIIPEMIYTVILTSVIYQLLAYINYRLEMAERRSATKFV